MRASKTVSRSTSKVRDIHISGAEGLYEDEDIQGATRKFIKRALEHKRGKADKIVITVEKIKNKPRIISSLPVSTINCKSPSEAKRIIRLILKSLDVSETSIEKAFKIIRKDNMRGAAIISIKKGHRFEPDKERGVRVSRLGISKPALRELSLKLSRHGINREIVKEALILASKVSSCKEVIAELCISDNPDYTTGYVSSRHLGYLRIPNIKNKGSKMGGRVFFIKEGSNVENLIEYLEKSPVIIAKIGFCKGKVSLSEILNNSYR